MQAMEDLHIDADDPATPECQSLIDAHLMFARTHTPPGHVHALGSEALGVDGVSFFTARRNGVPIGMAALRDLGDQHAEIKSIHTSAEHRGEGVARSMLEYVIEIAREREMKRLSLETGTQPAFAPARSFFESLGFEVCDPFADYTDNPNSVCMTLVVE
ncbi:MAG: GNAT family N-acetyltransferase [Acidimicrobiia bacterium]|nr:GNAT family N-acetyltransferase [Acidimicrobiia bacterium]NNL28655.1 GNAT family N-acetyltransferase [Acidimicrobiia bacterium]